MPRYTDSIQRVKQPKVYNYNHSVSKEFALDGDKWAHPEWILESIWRHALEHGVPRYACWWAEPNDVEGLMLIDIKAQWMAW